jgi:hypothetical protein
MRIIYLFGFTVMFLLVFNGPVMAEETVKDVITGQYSVEKDICTVVKNTIRNGMDTKEVTKTAIQMGHDACLVVRCAIEADGSLEDIINGAMEAGTTKDVCAKCAVIAGADPAVVAGLLETALGYSPPLAAGIAPIELGLPGGNKGGGFMSPSGF